MSVSWLPPDEVLREAVAAQTPFKIGKLAGAPCTPFRSTPEGKRWEQGSVGRVFAGALNEIGTGGVIGGGRLPDIGWLDPAPAMHYALYEANYIIRYFTTPLAWHLGPEVAGGNRHDEGDWILPLPVKDAYGEWWFRYSRTSSKYQNMIKAALNEARQPWGPPPG